jgi:hypothetical protein
MLAADAVIACDQADFSFDSGLTCIGLGFPTGVILNIVTPLPVVVSFSVFHSIAIGLTLQL